MHRIRMSLPLDATAYTNGIGIAPCTHSYEGLKPCFRTNLISKTPHFGEFFFSDVCRYILMHGGHSDKVLQYSTESTVISTVRAKNRTVKFSLTVP
jgi:hypothetical protein